MSARALSRRTARTGVRKMVVPIMGAIGLAGNLLGSRSRKPSPTVNTILVIRIDLMGDILFSMPAVLALRRQFPHGHISMLTLPYTAPLARLYPQIDEVIAVDTNRIRRPKGLISPATWLEYISIYRRLRSRHFDLCLSLSGPMASFWAFLSGAKRTIGYQDEAYPLMLSEPMPGGRYQERVHEVEYVRRLARASGAENVPKQLEPPHVPERARKSVSSMLRQAGIDDSTQVVVVHPGAINGAAKRWPAADWANLLTELEARTAARPALIGAASDLPIAERVLRQAPRDTLNLVGRTNLEELSAVIERADLVATGDSGPLHLAVALRRPLLAVYGPTDPAIHGPYEPQAPVRLHRHNLACSPCYGMLESAECPLGDPICMRLVLVDSMLASALELLGQEAQRPH